jgi:hypothetical protein
MVVLKDGILKKIEKAHTKKHLQSIYPYQENTYFTCNPKQTKNALLQTKSCKGAKIIETILVRRCQSALALCTL